MGDRNTSFFHAKASSRFQRNHIDGIVDENNCWQEDEAKIADVFVKYYSDLFTSPQPTEFDEVLNAVQPKVSEIMNGMLTAEFQAAEVPQALKQMYATKAPGPDGMPPLFYQLFWPTIGNCVIKTMLNFLNHGLTPPKFNDTHIVLIPKVKNPTKVIEYRPISLYNVVYKLASKILANRLRKNFPPIISVIQSVFVHGRLIAFETMHHISQKREGKVGKVSLKLGMSKAYDRVEWVWLEKIMEKLGFSGRWRSLVFFDK